MHRDGFLQIIIGIVVVVVLAVGAGGYFLGLKQNTALPTLEMKIDTEQMTSQDISTEAESASNMIQEVNDVSSKEEKLTPQPAAKTEPAKQIESVVQKEQVPPVHTPSYACSDGTLFYQCSEELPLHCKKEGLVSDCTYCECPDKRVCAVGGTCTELIFKLEDIASYNSWDKINQFLSEFGLTALFKYYDTTIIPSEAEKEQLKESLSYITYIFKEIFGGTPIKNYLKDFKEIRFNYQVGSSFNEGPLWRGDRDYFQVSLLSRLLEAEGVPSTDRYMIIALHEIGHVVHENLTGVAPELRNEFDGLCWDGAQLKLACQDREKSFVTMDMTIIKPFIEMASQQFASPEYYALKNVMEDFAETFAAYIASPVEFRELAEKSPKLAEKYNFMKTRIFGSKEF